MTAIGVLSSLNRYALSVLVSFFCLLQALPAAEPAAPVRSIPIAVSNAVFKTHGSLSGTCVVSAGPLTPVTAVAFGADGKTLAAGGYGEVLLWDLGDAVLRKRIGAGVFNQAVRALAFRKGGQWLAAGDGAPGISGAVRLFNIGSGEPVADFSGPKDVVSGLAFSPDGKFLAAGCADSVVRVWNVEQKTASASLSELQGGVLGVAFSGNGNYLAAAGAGRLAQVWETGKWNPVCRMQQTDTVNGLAFDPADEWLAMAIGGSFEHGVRAQKIEYPEAEAEPVPPKSSVVSGGATASAKPTPPAKPGATPDKRKKAAKPPPRAFATGAGIPTAVLWSATGKAPRLYVACTDGTIRVYGNFGGLQNKWAAHDDWVDCLALSPDATMLASGGADGMVKLWSAVTGRLLATLVQTACRSDRWAIVTPQGNFQTSCPDAIQWKTADSKPLEPAAIEALANQQATRQALSGATPTPTPKPKPVPKPAAKPVVSPKPAPSAPPKPAQTPTAVPAHSPTPAPNCAPHPVTPSPTCPSCPPPPAPRQSGSATSPKP